ncbi:cleft lip and palate transmembrane protein 1 homolog [Limulus polyphemus]|uniref:Cleft lip and palate transmembrane protein 1 homolog n=1 Tax=Limulus polyphemus TaxID=6850 RepID=A0ABM1BJF3_LIMPO|nr:cleft lip and palate transmembrane protein 1 homolog [Limulus polyphemus]
MSEDDISNNVSNDSLVQNESSTPDQQTSEPQQQQQAFSWAGVIKGIVIRALIIYFITSFFRRPQTSPDKSFPSSPSTASSNIFNNGTVMDMYIYVSEDENQPVFNNSEQLVWLEKGLVYGDWYGGSNGDGTSTHETKIVASSKLQNNGSLWLHVYIVKSGRSPDPSEKTHSRIYTVYKKKRLNKFKKLRYQRTHNLLTGETALDPELVKKSEKNTEEILSHWHPNITINIIDDHTAWVQGHVPPPLDEFIDFEPTTGKYYPVVFLNDYWNLMREYQPINKTTKYLSLRLTYQPLSLFRWQLYAAQTMRSRWTSVLGQNLMEESDEEQDTMKETFLETSPYLLGITIIVSLFHSVFEFLAFKNDIQFWKNRKSLEGLSVRSIFFNVFQSVVVLLYVLDNDTNTLVKISVFIGLVIEIWKIHKVVNVQIKRDQKIFGILPKITFTDKGSYVESSTKDYDILAFKYLSWLLFPLLGCYFIYSLIYLEHRGWYSFTLNMMYGFLLTFGFIMMTPQLFINYKLKSVAHLPWRMLTYKFLNTFIDDIFAFVIKMPTMYRLGCFRDDIVFLIFLYQRWIYRVDPKRVNEFGISGEMHEQDGNTANGAVVTSEEAGNSIEEKKKN